MRFVMLRREIDDTLAWASGHFAERGAELLA
jgi:hypothetical protein